MRRGPTQGELSMTELDRRSFLKTSAAGRGALRWAGRSRACSPSPAFANHTVLVPAPDLRDGEDPPARAPGFSYRSFHDTEYPAQSMILDDGRRAPRTPRRHGAFDGARRRRDPGPQPREWPGLGSPVQVNSSIYDASAWAARRPCSSASGVSRRSAIASLTGTLMNCSGGPMPWGSWITCEETVNGPTSATTSPAPAPGGTDPGPFTNIQNPQFEKPHGYIFEVPDQRLTRRRADHARGPVRPRGGRLGPASTGELYLTEDNFSFPSGFYQYLPRRPARRAGRIGRRGQLHMLKVKGRPTPTSRQHQVAGTTFEVEWVDIDQPDFDAGTPPRASRRR